VRILCCVCDCFSYFVTDSVGEPANRKTRKKGQWSFYNQKHKCWGYGLETPLPAAVNTEVRRSCNSPAVARAMAHANMT
jgi:hypothetical protein